MFSFSFRTQDLQTLKQIFATLQKLIIRQEEKEQTHHVNVFRSTRWTHLVRRGYTPSDQS